MKSMCVMRKKKKNLSNWKRAGCGVQTETDQMTRRGWEMMEGDLVKNVDERRRGDAAV